MRKRDETFHLCAPSHWPTFAKHWRCTSPAHGNGCTQSLPPSEVRECHERAQRLAAVHDRAAGGGTFFQTPQGHALFKGCTQPLQLTGATGAHRHAAGRIHAKLGATLQERYPAAATGLGKGTTRTESHDVGWQALGAQRRTCGPDGRHDDAAGAGAVPLCRWAVEVLKALYVICQGTSRCCTARTESTVNPSAHLTFSGITTMSPVPHIQGLAHSIFQFRDEPEAGLIQIPLRLDLTGLKLEVYGV